jgi:hypothetical protein
VLRAFKLTPAAAHVVVAAASDVGAPVKLCRDDNGKLDCNL